MALDPQIVRRDKASKHLRQPGEIYQGIVTSVKDDGRVFVKVPSLGITSGPIVPVNSSPSNRLSVGDAVICSFNNIYNSSLIVFGTATQSADDYAISRYATAAERDSQITSPQEGRAVYILNTDELQIYNGSSWVTISDVTTSGSLSLQTLSVSGSTSLSSSTSIGNVSSTEIGYLDGVTSSLQNQINGKAPIASPSLTGSVSISGSLSVSGEFSYHPTPKTSSVDVTLQLSDDGKIIKMTNGSSASVTIPLNSSVAFPIGSQVTVIRYGSGSLSIVGSSSVSVRATPGQSLRAQYSSATALKIDSDEWILMGDLVV